MGKAGDVKRTIRSSRTTIKACEPVERLGCGIETGKEVRCGSLDPGSSPDFWKKVRRRPTPRALAWKLGGRADVEV